ncbi:hypothetical protein ACSSS7_006891 [Eimeria intestinalis]
MALNPQFTLTLLKQLSAIQPARKLQCRVIMRFLTTTLKLCIDYFKRDWAVFLPAAALAYRSTFHSVTRFSPYFLLTGVEILHPLSREWLGPVLHHTGARSVHALWRCRPAVFRPHQRITEEDLELFLAEPHHSTSRGLAVPRATAAPERDRPGGGRRKPKGEKKAAGEAFGGGAPSLVVGKLKPADLKDMKNAEKKLAKAKTQEA